MYCICYVLVDDEHLFFYNQLMISVSSLRHWGYKGTVYLFTDHETGILLSDKTKELSAFSIEMKPVDVPDGLSIIEKSRFIKTNLREYVSGDFLYIDTDTIIAGKLPEIISSSELAMVTDRHYETLKKDTVPYRFSKPFFEILGINDIEGKVYYNAGVLWAKDTPNTHLLYERWHKKWKDGVCKGLALDQQALNAVIWETNTNVTRLDDAFNTQTSARDYLDFNMLSKAIIIHYFNFSKERGYLLAQSEYKRLSYTDEKIQSIINSPKTAFSNSKLIETYTDEYALTNSLPYRALLFIYKKHRSIFNILDKIIRIVFKK